MDGARRVWVWDWTARNVFMVGTGSFALHLSSSRKPGVNTVTVAGVDDTMLTRVRVVVTFLRRGDKPSVE